MCGQGGKDLVFILHEVFLQCYHSTYTGSFFAAGNCLKRSIKIIEAGIGKRRLVGEASLRAFGCGIL